MSAAVERPTREVPPSTGSAADGARGLLPSLSLPRGGGAIRGIGEKFQANAARGTGTLSVPLATSPGRAGFDVAMSLSYDSGAGNGPFGIGWRLSVPHVARKTDKGVPRYDAGDEPDVFVLSGAEDLVPVRDGAGDRGDGGATYRVQRYQPRSEGGFARIERWTDRVTGDVHWRATTRDDVTSVYGRSARARVADPERPRRVLAWLLEETRDGRGDLARYHYKAEDGAGVDPGRTSEQHHFEVGADGTRSFRSSAQRYLKRVEYGNVHAGDASAFCFEVVLDYGEHDDAHPTPLETRPWPVRRDPFSSHRAGFEVRTYRLCRRVLMFHRFRELGPEPCLVRSTDLGYRETPVVSYLETIVHAGYQRDPATGGYRRKALPALACGYIEPALHDRVETLDAASLEGIEAGVAGVGPWIDLDGEGLPGVLIASEGAWTYKRNLGGGRFDPPRRQRTLPAPAELAGGVQQLADLGSDGALDLVRYSPPLAGYFERVAARGEEPGDWQPFVPLHELPRIDWNDPNLRFVDLDGDGHPDVLVTEHDALVWYRSRGKAGFEPAARVRKPRDERDGPAVVFADGTETLHLADMTGDGLADLVRVRNGEVCYWPSQGHGRFGRKVTMNRSPRFDAPERFDPRRVRLADIDGSGTTDVLYLGADDIAIYVNEAGNGFAERAAIRSLPPTDGLASVGVVDLLGRGTACLVWSSAAPAARGRSVRYVDLMGGKKPHLLERVVNNLGAETRIAYAPSTKFYLDDLRAGRPWLTRLPFPVHVIERVETYDHIARARLVTSYRYHHGFFDGHERELGGFACVETLDAEAFGDTATPGLFPDAPGATDAPDATANELRLPPVLTKTWFHVGAWLERERLERALAAEYDAGDPDAPPPLPDTILPPGLSTREEREAARALRGQVLRQEIYALDESPASAHPYRVRELSYEVRLVQRAERAAHAVFLVHPRETVTLHYERRPRDPRIQHELVLDVDAFGNVTRSASIAYPRRQPVEPEQGQRWALATEAAFANEPHAEGPYRLGVPVETLAVELVGLAPPADGRLVSPDELRAALAGAIEIPYEVTAGATALARRTVEHQRSYYYADDLSGPLPLGQIGERALLYETRTLALTPGLVAQVYGDRVDADLLAGPGGYVLDDGAWWAPSGRLVYDAERFYLPIAAIDPFGNVSHARYDAYALLVHEVEDARGNRITADHDYRVLAPARVHDPNGNRTAAEFDELGLVVRTAVMGKPGEALGDHLDDGLPPTPSPAALDAFLADPRHARELLGTATTRVVYDLDRFARLGEPPLAATLARETHVSDLSPGQHTEVRVAFTYFDGFGREVQQKIEAGPGPLVDGGPIVEPRWVGSGWTIYNNKGKPVRRYEPFFDDTHGFRFDAVAGVSSVRFYDPVERVVATLHPDHTYEKVVFDAWRQAAYDRNDTVTSDPRTDPDVGALIARLPDAASAPTWYARRVTGELGTAEEKAAHATAIHADTPAVTHVDSLGRPFLTVAHNRFVRGGVTHEELHATRVELDIEGNTLGVTDARDRVVMRYTHDVLGRRAHQASMEAGERRILLDVLGQPLCVWDSRGHRTRTTYDELRRPVATYLREGSGPERLVGRTAYGEDELAPEAHNQRGRVVRVLDQAGVATSDAYDFKGNLLRGARTVAPDYDRIYDWSAEAVDPAWETFHTSTTYDALGRVITATAPDGSVYRPRFNEAQLLDRVEVALRGSPSFTPFVVDVAYDAQGRRTSIGYANGAATSYAYDPDTLRLTRLATRRGADGVLLQDLRYTYDPSGHITHIRDAAHQATFFANAVATPENDYTYDAVYRLIAATGREHIGQVLAPESTWSDEHRVGRAHPQDIQAMRGYTERYTYDLPGNLEELRHEAGGTTWTRTFAHEEASLLEPAHASNRLTRSIVHRDTSVQPADVYAYDPHGNLLRMPHLPHMAWSYADELRTVDLGGGGTAHYVYDGAGQRVRKILTRHNGTRRAERLYLGGFEIYRELAGDGVTIELRRETLHVMDGDQRLALVETQTIDDAAPLPSPSPVTRYQLGNHLGSATLELDAAAHLLSYEEYTPYGSTSYQAARGLAETSLKRYRYTAMERDTETGLAYHGARYYAPWLARWTSCDPIGLRGGLNLYGYCEGNCIGAKDASGTQPASHRLNMEPNDAENQAVMFGEPVSELYIARESLRREVGGGQLTTFEHKIAAARAWQGEAIPLDPWNPQKTFTIPTGPVFSTVDAVLTPSQLRSAQALRYSDDAGVNHLEWATFNDGFIRYWSREGNLLGASYHGSAYSMTPGLGASVLNPVDLLSGAVAGPVGHVAAASIEHLARRSAQVLLATRTRLMLRRLSPKGARGPASGRDFDPDAAGGPIRSLSIEKIRVLPKAIEVIERHLSRFGYDADNAKMISRLREISSGRLAPTSHDLNFYAHELREFVRYRRLGHPSGNPGHEVWNNAHTATLEEYGVNELVRPHPLYHPSVRR